MRITMIGSGYVGLVSGTCLAEIGHEVVCVDLDEKKIRLLSEGHSPIFEPGIEGLIRKNLDDERLSFTTDLKAALMGSHVAFIAVGTPQGEDGSADLKYVQAVARQIANYATSDLMVIVKSTVPVGSCDEVEEIITSSLADLKKDIKIVVASNPEFLKEGAAIADFMKPERIVVGLKQAAGEELIRDLYNPFMVDDPTRLLLVERRASELIKYASNTMLACRISFMNELSQLCDKLDVNIDQVRVGMGSDSRIGKKFLYAGPGFGGSCFPKDVYALLKLAEENDVDLKVLRAAKEANEGQKRYVSKKIATSLKELKGKKIAVWGLSFKPNTDDVREAPAKTIIESLLEGGAQVQAHDPQGSENFAREFGDHTALNYYQTNYQACQGADALVLITEWGEYKWPNWGKIREMMSGRSVFDFRNQYHAAMMAEHGFDYECIGRPPAGQQLKPGAAASKKGGL